MNSPVKKSSKKAVKAKVVAVHSKNNEMVVAAILSLNERRGSSYTAILKYIAANYKLGHDDKKIKVHLTICIRNGVNNGLLKKVKGTGASRYKVAKPLNKVVKKADALKIPINKIVKVKND